MPLKIHIPASELWDSKNNCFIYTKAQNLTLEHSLVSLAKWESKWHIPFMSNNEKTDEQVIDYIRCMTITQNVDDEVYKYIPGDVIKEVDAYIKDPMTATWFGKEDDSTSNRIITAELLYYLMFVNHIPMECQKWHLNRLITQIKVCNEENKPKKESSLNDIYSRHRKLNEERRKATGSKG